MASDNLKMTIVMTLAGISSFFLIFITESSLMSCLWDKRLRNAMRVIKLLWARNLFISNCGIANWYLKNYDKAVANFTEVIKLDPEAASTYERRAAAYRGMGNTREAEADGKSRGIECRAGSERKQVDA